MSNPTDDNGNVRVDFAWGNMPMQPNDGREANGGELLDPLLDNHEIVYTARSGFPGYAPGNSTPPAGSGTLLVFENIEAGIDTDAVKGVNEYGQLLSPFSMTLQEAYSDMFGNLYGTVPAATLRISLTVDETTEEGELFYNAWLQQQVLGASSMGQSTVPSAPNSNPDANYLEANAFTTDVLNLLPRISLKDAYLVDSYGQPLDVSTNNGTVPGTFTDIVEMTDDVEANLLVPATFDSGWGAYLTRGEVMNLDRLSNVIYTLRFSFPARADEYGGFPSAEEAAFIGDETATATALEVGNALGAGMAFNVNLRLGGKLEILLPDAPQPVTTPLTLTLTSDSEGIDTPEINSSDMYNQQFYFYMQRSYEDSSNVFGTNQVGFMGGTGITWGLLVDESTAIGKRFKQAWEEQQEAFGWDYMNGQRNHLQGIADDMGIPAEDIKAWYEEFVPSLPVFDFSGMTFQNSYGVNSDPLTANVATDSESFALGGYSGMGITKYIRRQQSDLTGWARYEFKGQFLNNYDVYGGTPTAQQWYFAGTDGVDGAMSSYGGSRLVGDLKVKFYN